MADFEDDAIEVWPENWVAVMLFCDLGTQWRHSHSGPVGLDYNVLFHKLDRMNLNDAEYDALELDIQVLERAALAEIHKPE